MTDCNNGQMPYVEISEDIRARLKVIEVCLRNSMMNHDIYRTEARFMGQHSEMKAQTMLAIRHIEDARMRVGKMIQYSGDGISIFDKKEKS